MMGCLAVIIALAVIIFMISGLLTHPLIGALIIGVVVAIFIAAARNEKSQQDKASRAPAIRYEETEAPAKLSPTLAPKLLFHSGYLRRYTGGLSADWIFAHETSRDVFIAQPCTLKIYYENEAGERTTRNIQPRKCTAIQNEKGSKFMVYISGHCDLRGEERTFRADRILSCVDVATGETVKDLFDVLKKKPEKIIIDGRSIVMHDLVAPDILLTYLTGSGKEKELTGQPLEIGFWQNAPYLLKIRPRNQSNTRKIVISSITRMADADTGEIVELSQIPGWITE